MINSHKLEEKILAHSTLIIGVIIAAAFAGAGYYAYDFYKIKQESQAQIELYKADKMLNSILAEDQKKEADLRKAAKDKKAFTPPAKTDHDYTTIIEQYRKVIREYPSSQASLNAAINASDLFLQKKQYQEALAQLGVVDNNVDLKMLKKDNLLAGIIRLKIAALFETTGKCQSTNVNEGVLKPVIESKKFDFLKPEALLRVALCAEQIGKKDQAKEFYQKVIQEYPETPASQDAEKYLRLLEIKG